MKRTVIVVLSLLAAVLLTFPLLGQTGTAPPTSKPPSPPAPLVVSQTINIPYSNGVWQPFSMLWHQLVPVNQYDQSSGLTVTGVRVTFQPFWAIFLNAENLDVLSPCLWKWWLSVTARLLSPKGSIVIEDSDAWELDPWFLYAYDSVPDFHGISGRSEAAINVGLKQTMTLAPSEIRNFVGQGQTFFDLVRFGSYIYEATTANGIGAHNRTLAGTLTVEITAQ